MDLEKRTGLSISMVMLLPRAMVVIAAGAPMEMRWASAEAAKQARARKDFMTDARGTWEAPCVVVGRDGTRRKSGVARGIYTYPRR